MTVMTSCNGTIEISTNHPIRRRRISSRGAAAALIQHSHDYRTTDTTKNDEDEDATNYRTRRQWWGWSTAGNGEETASHRLQQPPPTSSPSINIYNIYPLIHQSCNNNNKNGGSKAHLSTKDNNGPSLRFSLTLGGSGVAMRAFQTEICLAIWIEINGWRDMAG